MIERLKKCKERYEVLTNALAKQNATDDFAQWQKNVKEHAELEEIVREYDAFVSDQEELASCKELLFDHLDAEMKELVQAEISELEQRLTKRT